MTTTASTTEPAGAQPEARYDVRVNQDLTAEQILRVHALNATSNRLFGTDGPDEALAYAERVYRWLATGEIAAAPAGGAR